MSVKRIQKRLLQAENKLKGLVDKTGSGVTFEDTGIDYLFIDETHNYKNLETESKHPGSVHRRLRTRKQTEHETRIPPLTVHIDRCHHIRHRPPHRESP